MEEKIPKTPEQIRADARDRKRAQRERDYVARDQSRLSAMDPTERRVREIWAEAMAKPITKPGVPLPDPGPARLPTLQEWLKCLKQIKSAAAQAEIIRVEAAIESGMSEFQRRVGEHANET